MSAARNAGIHHQLLELPFITRAGYLNAMPMMITNSMIDSAPVTQSTGTPNQFTLAGDAWYRSGRRLGSAIAAAPTMITASAPASTIMPSTSWNECEYTLQTTTSAMITFAVRIAVTGECVRSFTLASPSGISRSNDQAKNERIGMYVFAIIDGRLQNRNVP